MNEKKIAVSTEAGGKEFWAAVENLTKCGFEYAEISLSHGEVMVGLSANERQEARRRFEDAGLKITQGHLRNRIDLGNALTAKRQEALDITRQWIDTYAELGITAGAIHVGGWQALYENIPSQQVLELQCDSVRQLAEHTRNMPLRVALENTPDTAPGLPELLAIIDGAGADNIGICLDIGHLNLTPNQADEFIRGAGKRLIALHLHDNTGMHVTARDTMGFWYKDDLHIPPIFSPKKGGVDWNAAAAALAEIAYSGLYNFELGNPGPDSSRRDFLRWLRTAGQNIFSCP